MISAIIPARNEEASIRRTVESLAEQPEIAEIIVVDDQSTDGTAMILDELARLIPKLNVRRTVGLPPGWVGKNHALSIGAATARCEWLLFTDADTYHLPGAASRALADASLNNADLVSYSPEQEMRTLWERALIPVVYWRLSQQYPFDRVNNIRSPDAAANGQYILIRRTVYASIGGHALIAHEIVEDVALAKRAKDSGRTIFFAPGRGIVKTRMYDSFGAMWEGWTKNLYPLFGGSPRDIVFEIFAATPLLGAFFSAVMTLEVGIWGCIDGMVVIIAAVFWLAPWVWCGHWLWQNRYPVNYIQYYFLGACLYAGALITSWWKNTHGAVSWKGRRYPSHIPGAS